MGLLAGKNDLKLLEETKVGRNINRHYYTEEEIREQVSRPVVRKLLELMKFRNTHPAFDGAFILKDSNEQSLRIRRENGAEYAELYADFKELRLRIIYSKNGMEKTDEIV